MAIISTFWNRNISDPILGFEKMYFKEAFHYTEKMGMGIADKEFLSQSIDLLKTHQSPVFAFLITMSSHYPYLDMPDSYRALFGNTIHPESMLNGYLQSIRYVDDAVGEFFSKAEKAGFWENSIFVIYGDHRPGCDEEMNAELKRVTGRSLLTSRYSCVPVIRPIWARKNLLQNTTKNTQMSSVGFMIYSRPLCI